MFFRTFAVWAVGLPITVLFFILALLASLTGRNGRLIHSLGALWCRIILFLSGVKVYVRGMENIPRDRPVIFLSNHQGAFDIPVLQGYLPVQFRWVAKKSLFKIPVMGWAMRLAGYIGIEREHSKAAYRSIIEASRKIKNGTSILVFPEGTRSQGDFILTFKRGAFLLAAKSGVQVLPIAIRGTRDILKRSGFFIRPEEVLLSIGRPIEAKDTDEKELMDRVRNVIENLFNESKKVSG